MLFPPEHVLLVPEGADHHGTGSERRIHGLIRDDRDPVPEDRHGNEVASYVIDPEDYVPSETPRRSGATNESNESTSWGEYIVIAIIILGAIMGLRDCAG